MVGSVYEQPLGVFIMKSFITSKTLWFNLIAITVKFLQDNQSYIDPQIFNRWFVPVVVIGSTIIRFNTSTSLSMKLK